VPAFFLRLPFTVSAARGLIGHCTASNRTASCQDILTSAATQLVAQGAANHGTDNRCPSALNLSLANRARRTGSQHKKTCHNDRHSKFFHKDSSSS
jgi:hypothetical protein